MANYYASPIFKLPYVGEVGQPVTAQIEKQRFLTLDVQLENLYAILGNGIIAGWEISLDGPPNPDGSTPERQPLTIYIKPGRGHVDSMAAESLAWTKISGLTDGTSVFPGINYIYAARTETTPDMKDVKFFISSSPLAQENLVPLGLCTVVNRNIAIDSSSRVEIGFLSILLGALSTHRHGKDGIAPIDLASEVKGFLSSSNIGDIPAERITSGIIDPKHYTLSHLSLLNSGDFSHEDIDSIIEQLQKSNQRLFGDVSATNLVQLVIATKHTLTQCDRFFRNMIVIIPGVDNVTFDSANTFLDPTSTHEQNMFDTDTMNYTNYDGDLVEFREDAAVVDYVEGEIKGVISGGTSIHEYTVDTEAEFSDGNYNPDYISVSSDEDVTEVTLERGVADKIIFNNSTDNIVYPTGYTLSEDDADIADTDDTTTTGNLIEKFKYVFPATSGGGAGASPAKFQNPRLMYNFDQDDENSGYDWTSYDAFTIRLKNTTMSDVEMTVNGDWFITFYSATGPSDTVEYLGLENGTILAIDAGDSLALPFDISTIAATGPFDRSQITGWKLSVQNYDDVFIIETGVEPIDWDGYIDIISLGGELLYSTTDSNNTINELFFVVPVSPAAELDSISWVAQEPSDSRVRIFVKSVDANGAGDGFTLLAAASFPTSYYTNKARGVETVRPSGSTMSEQPGTHFEIKVVLDPSVNASFAPVLNSITIRYTVQGNDEVIKFDTAPEWDIVQDGVQRINISLTSGDPSLEIDSKDNISSRRCGSNSRFYELHKDNLGIYRVDTSGTDYTGQNLPKTQAQYLDTSLTRGYSYTAAVKRMNDQNIIVADTGNHRIAIINPSNHEMIWCLSGTTTYKDSTILDKLAPVFCHLNRNTSTLYVSFTHIVSGTINLSKWFIADSDSYFKLNNIPSANGGDTISIINANGIGGIAGGGTVAVKLGIKSQANLDKLSGALSLSINTTSITSPVISEVKTSAFSSIPVEEYNITYTEMSYPVDVVVDDDDNILMAQALDSSSARDTVAITKFSVNNPDLKMLELNAASDGIMFAFDKDYLGSVEEIIDSGGNREVLVADMNNQRVIRFDQADGTVVWQFSRDASGGRASIQSNLYPSSATLGKDGKFYVSLIDKSNSRYSRIVQVTNDIKITKTILEGTVSNPKDVKFKGGNKLLITT